MNHPVSTPRNLSSRPSTPRTPRHSLFGKQTLAPIPSIVLPARPRPNRAPAPEGHLPSTWRQRRNEPNQFGGELPPNSSQCRYRRRALVHSISEQQTFLSVDDETGEDVFLREIRKYKGEGVASESARRLANEVNTLRTLQGCPSVLEFKDQFQTAEKLVVVTEACHGGTLQHVLEKRGPQSEAVAKCIARDIVSVLEACEREGIEHGKVHPQNFWIKSLRDFATVAKGNSTQRTVGGSLLRSIRMGSCGSQGMSEKARGAGMGVLYWAPEVFVDQPASNSDIWSMGVLLYNVLTGQNPIWSQEEIDWIAELPKGEQGLWFSLLRDLLWRQVDFSTKELAGVSEECKSFLKVTLSKNSQQRISLQEARNHPWLKEIAATAPPSGSSGAGNEEKKPQQQAEQRGNDRCVGNRFTLATRSRKLPLRQTIPTRTQQKQLVNRRW